MIKFFVSIFVTVALIFQIYVNGQTTNITTDKPPGDIVLSKNYVHLRGEGVDTLIGSIKKDDQMDIRYDIGRAAGNYAKGFSKSDRNKLLWTKKQKVNGLTLILARFNDGGLIATFRETCANFWTWDAKTDELVSDFLSMILTYKEKPGPRCL